MKKSRFTEKQILKVLRELEAGVSVIGLTRKHGISGATIYRQTKFGEMTESDLRRLRQLEEEVLYEKQCLKAGKSNRL